MYTPITTIELATAISLRNTKCYMVDDVVKTMVSVKLLC